MLIKPTRRELIRYGIGAAALAKMQAQVRIPGPGGAAAAGGGPALVDYVVGPATPSSSGGVSADIDTTGATLLVIISTAYSTDVAGDLMESYGNTWTSLTKYTATDPPIQMLYAVNPTVGVNHNFTITRSGTYYRFVVLAFSGIATVSPFIAGTDHGAAAGSYAPLQPGSVTVADGQLIVTGYSTGFDTGTASIDSSFASPIGAAFINFVGWGIWASYRVASGALTVNPTWSNSATGVTACAAIAGFKQ